tara:strand:- start:6513 stop:6758 length:246 start_codon:yes stop_codon:yes gene_type:complete
MNETPEQQKFIDDWNKKTRRTYELTDDAIDFVVKNIESAISTNSQTVKQMMTDTNVEMTTLESIMEKGLKLKMIYEEFVDE